jgi:ADP-ribose pyrophosphatase
VFIPPFYQEVLMMRNLQPWTVRNRRTLFEHHPYVRLEVDNVELPDGRQVDDYYRVTVPDYATVVAKTANGVIMLRQYKHGAGCISYTTPAGHIDNGETPLIAAQRELLEETGYQASDWELLGTFIISGNCRLCKCHIFQASNAIKIASPDSGDLEEMEIKVLSPVEICNELGSGGIVLSSTALALALCGILPQNTENTK